MSSSPSQPYAACGALSSFEACRNTQQGSVVILGSGVSAKDFPIAEFSSVPVIAMNGSIAMLDAVGLGPFFYLCTDRDFPRQQPELFATAVRTSAHLALWPEQLESLEVPPGTVCYPLSKAKDPGLADWLGARDGVYVRNRALWSKRSRSIGFSKDLSHGFFDARTVAYVALQLAYHLGFDDVLLVGLDMNQSAGRFYEREGQARSPCGLDQHWERRILPSLSLMADQVLNRDFRAYNLSASSRIPDTVIPKISLSEARRLACLNPAFQASQTQASNANNARTVPTTRL